jgi:hypothetical protein
MNKTRIAAFLLAALTLVPAVMTSCGGDTPSTSDDTKAPEATEAVTEAATEPVDMLEARLSVDDGVETKDYNGAPFRIVTSDNQTKWYWVEAETGSVVDDEIFRRNSKVEERFNVKMEVTLDKGYADTSRHVSNTIKAADDSIELVAMHAIECALLAIKGNFLNWYDVPSINFEQPWWADSTIEDLSYEGVAPVAIGDFVMTAMASTYCTFYNKTLAANYDLPNMYDVVKEGKWTIDYITSIAKDIYQDLNGNNEVDSEDFFGYASDTRSAMDAYLWAFDNPIFTRDGDKPVYSYKTEKINNIVSKLVNTFTAYNGISGGFEASWNYGRDLFMVSRVVFATGVLNHSIANMADMTDEIGFLPYPKWDEAQKEYHTLVDGSHQALAVPTTVADPAMIGAVTEVLNAESWKTVIPAYYDVALKVKATRDLESVEMIDLVVNSRKFDFGYIYDGWAGPSFILSGLVQAKNSDFESTYAKKEKGIDKHYTKVIEWFENYEG